ncbi:hypothetical protein T492DRAFT_1105479 [Pavlovales sp. CCMP2436]|nr:hypothetical protein T492DRAFT_1105479 [Pavlovales sp. CCMP2436]
MALRAFLDVPSRAHAVLSERTVEVCLSKHCTKRGSLRTLELLQAMAPDGTVVVVADCSDTEHGCFDECTMGPNVRVGGNIVNGVKGPNACADLLGVDVPADLADA